MNELEKLHAENRRLRKRLAVANRHIRKLAEDYAMNLVVTRGDDVCSFVGQTKKNAIREVLSAFKKRRDLKVENERLKIALKPFAALGAVIEPDWKDEIVYGWYDCEKPVEIRVNDLRNAAKVMKGGE